MDIFSGTKAIFSYIFLISQNYCVIILQYVTLQREIFHGSGREEEKMIINAQKKIPLIPQHYNLTLFISS